MDLWQQECAFEQHFTRYQTSANLEHRISLGKGRGAGRSHKVPRRPRPVYKPGQELLLDCSKTKPVYDLVDTLYNILSIYSQKLGANRLLTCLLVPVLSRSGVLYSPESVAAESRQ